MRLKTIYDTTWSLMQHSPCHCCGMQYTEPKVPLKTLETTTGIKVAFGIHGEEANYESLFREKIIKHVQTKNGDLTVIVERLKDEKSKDSKWTKVS